MSLVSPPSAAPAAFAAQLFKAAFDGSLVELAQLLQQDEVDPDSPFVHDDIGQWTPLHAACRSESAAIESPRYLDLFDLFLVFRQ